MVRNRRIGSPPQSRQKPSQTRAQRKADQLNVWRLLAKLCLGLYILVLYLSFSFKWIPFIHPLADLQLRPLPLQDTPPLNLVPGRSIAQYWLSLRSDPLHHTSLLNLWGNILAFVPLGLVMPLTLAGNLAYLRSLLTGLLLTLSIELTQLLLAVGVWDIDDILLNLTGVFLGLVLSIPVKFFLVKKLNKSKP